MYFTEGGGKKPCRIIFPFFLFYLSLFLPFIPTDLYSFLKELKSKNASKKKEEKSITLGNCEHLKESTFILNIRGLTAASDLKARLISRANRDYHEKTIHSGNIRTKKVVATVDSVFGLSLRPIRSGLISCDSIPALFLELSSPMRTLFSVSFKTYCLRVYCDLMHTAQLRMTKVFINLSEL